MNRDEFERHLRRVVPFFSLTRSQIETLWLHYGLLRRWNSRINLTRVIELESAVRLHYAECLFAANHAPADVKSVIDVGSGAGFPGFVFTVAKPEWQVTLLESDQRKAAFLREVSDLVPNLRVVACRSEEINGHWDLAVSRAVKAEDVLTFALRSAEWLMLIGTEPPAADKVKRPGWVAMDLPEGRGKLWLCRIGD